jgi:hypothetical protein
VPLPPLRPLAARTRASRPRRPRLASPARAVGFAGAVGRLAQNGDLQRYAALMAVAAAAILWTVLGVGGN